MNSHGNEVHSSDTKNTASAIQVCENTVDTISVLSGYAPVSLYLHCLVGECRWQQHFDQGASDAADRGHRK